MNEQDQQQPEENQDTSNSTSDNNSDDNNIGQQEKDKFLIKKQIISGLITQSASDTQDTLSVYQASNITIMKNIGNCDDPDALMKWVDTSHKLSNKTATNLTRRQINLYRKLVDLLD